MLSPVHVPTAASVVIVVLVILALLAVALAAVRRRRERHMIEEILREPYKPDAAMRGRVAEAEDPAAAAARKRVDELGRSRHEYE